MLKVLELMTTKDAWQWEMTKTSKQHHCWCVRWWSYSFFLGKPGPLSLPYLLLNLIILNTTQKIIKILYNIKNNINISKLYR